MPANVVKTPEDEKHWNEAKAQVEKEYPDVPEDSDRFWKLTMEIFRRMKHKTGGRPAPAPTRKSFDDFLADLRKAEVKGHYRTDKKTGKKVWVKPHSTARGKKAAAAPSGSTPATFVGKTVGDVDKFARQFGFAFTGQGLDEGHLLARLATGKGAISLVRFGVAQGRITSIRPSQESVLARVSPEQRDKAASLLAALSGMATPTMAGAGRFHPSVLKTPTGKYVLVGSVPPQFARKVWDNEADARRELADAGVTVKSQVVEGEPDFEKARVKGHYRTVGGKRVYVKEHETRRPAARVSFGEDEPDEDEPAGATCPACGGEGGHLGRLGNREHFRCINCGIDFSHENTPPAREAGVDRRGALARLLEQAPGAAYARLPQPEGAEEMEWHDLATDEGEGDYEGSSEQYQAGIKWAEDAGRTTARYQYAIQSNIDPHDGKRLTPEGRRSLERYLEKVTPDLEEMYAFYADRGEQERAEVIDNTFSIALDAEMDAIYARSGRKRPTPEQEEAARLSRLSRERIEAEWNAPPEEEEETPPPSRYQGQSVGVNPKGGWVGRAMEKRAEAERKQARQGRMRLSFDDFLADLRKAEVKGHYRTVGGKRVYVKPHSTKRTKKQQGGPKPFPSFEEFAQNKPAILRDLPDRVRHIAGMQAELEAMARGAGFSPFDQKVARSALQNIQDWTEAMSEHLFNLGVDEATSQEIFGQMDEAYEQRSYEMKSGGLRTILYNEEAGKLLRRHADMGRRLRAEVLDMEQRKSFDDFLADLRKARVKGHYRTDKKTGKRVWVQEHEQKRVPAKPKTKGSPKKAEKKKVLPAQPARPEWLPAPAYNRLMQLGAELKALNANADMPYSERRDQGTALQVEANKILTEHGTTPERREVIMDIGRVASGTKKSRPKQSWEARNRRKEIAAAKKPKTKASPRRPEEKEADVGGTNHAPAAPRSKASPKKEPAAPPALTGPVPTFQVGQIFEKVAPEQWAGQSMESRNRYRYTVEGIDAATNTAMVRLTHVLDRPGIGGRWKRKMKTQAKAIPVSRLGEMVGTGQISEVTAEQHAQDTGRERGPTFAPAELRTIFNEAFAAAKQAGDEHVPIPMIVEEHANPLDDTSEVVRRYPPAMGGVCGFAWVTIYPGNSQAAQYAKKQYGAKAAYEGGMQIWVSGYGQSYEKKTAYAEALAARLRQAGITAYAGGRLD